MAEQIKSDSDVKDAISDIEKCLDGKHSHELNALKNSIKVEHQAKEIQISKLQNEVELLKSKSNRVEEETAPKRRKKNEKQIGPSIKTFQEDILKDSYFDINHIIAQGIEKFFFGKENFLSNSYNEWFDVMATRLTKNTPYIFEKFVLVKVVCQDELKGYSFSSCSDRESNFGDRQANLNIFPKGFRHETTTVSILHPHHVNKSIQMKEDGKGEDFHSWTVDPTTNRFFRSGYFSLFLCMKK